MSASLRKRQVDVANFTPDNLCHFAYVCKLGYSVFYNLNFLFLCRPSIVTAFDIFTMTKYDLACEFKF